MENIIHSFWSTPSIKDKTIEHDRNNGGFLTEKHHAMSWALSCLSWKKYYGKITLYTDKKGKETHIIGNYKTVKGCICNLEDTGMIEIEDIGLNF